MTQVNHQPRPMDVKRVLIISLDGAKPTVIRQSRMPHLEGMLKRAAYTFKAQAVIPTITLVNHTSMLTGMIPAKHKITWNEWIPARGIVTVQTIFSLYKKHNKNVCTSLIAAKQKFTHLFLPGSLDHFMVLSDLADTVAVAAVNVIKQKKPDLMFVHFGDPDYYGHTYGWGSPQQMKSLAECDKAIEKIIRTIQRTGLLSETTILISADHGGHEKTHGMNVTDDREIPWIAYGAGVVPGAKLDAVSTIDTAATALWLLGVPIPPDMDGTPVFAAFTPSI